MNFFETELNVFNGCSEAYNYIIGYKIEEYKTKKEL